MFAFALLCLFILMPNDGMAQGCAMCKTIGGSEIVSVVGFNWSILLLATTPYLLIGAVGLWIVRHRRSTAAP